MTTTQHKSLYMIDHINSSRNKFTGKYTQSTDNINEINRASTDEERLSLAEDDWRVLLFVENPSDEIEAVIQLYLL